MKRNFDLRSPPARPRAAPMIVIGIAFLVMSIAGAWLLGYLIDEIAALAVFVVR